MADPLWFQSVAKVCHPGTRGTAFLVSDTQALTAFHVLKELAGATVELEFADRTRETCRAIAWDTEADWLLLERLAPVARPWLPLMLWDLGQPAWRTRGFPTAKPDGMNVGGAVTAWSVPWGEHRLIQLLCTEALSGNLKVPGISGAPCVLGDRGVVGMVRKSIYEDFDEVNVGGTLFACPAKDILAGLTRRGLPLPRALQPVSLERLAQLQRQRVLGELIEDGHFLPELHTPREPIESFLASLAHAARPNGGVCAVVGGSGVGKSSLLASVAHRSPAGHSLLLIRARHVQPGSQSLADVVGHELTRSAAEEHAPADVDTIALWQDAPQPKLILLDGLNELPTVVDAALWIERSVRWLRAHTATTLVLTCRPEFWSRCSHLIPPGLRITLPRDELPLREGENASRRASDAGDTAGTFTLADFDATEAADATRRAFGECPPIGAEDASHPLLLRMYLELARGAEDVAFTPSRIKVFDSFIQRKVHDATLSFRDAEPRSLRAALRALAVRLAQGEPAEDPQPLAVLMRTGLLDASREEIAFVHDEVLEYLASEAVRLPDYDADRLAQMSAGADQHRFGALKFAVLAALEQRPTDPEARRVLESLLAGPHWALNLVAQVLVSLPDASASIDLAARYYMLRTYHLMGSDSNRVLVRLRVPAVDKLRILIDVREHIEAFDFESHHWKDLERYVLRSGPLDWVGEVIESDPAAAFDELERWLGDSRELSDDKATVAHLAAALLVHFAAFDLERAFLAMVRRQGPARHQLFEAQPDATASFALRWLKNGELQDALPLCDWLVGRKAADQPLVAAMKEVMTSLPPKTPLRDRLRRVLIQARALSANFNVELLAELKRDRSQGMEHVESIRHLLRDEFEATLEVLNVLGRLNDAALSALGDFKGSVTQHAAIVRLLRRVLAGDIAANDFLVGHAVEIQLRRTPAGQVEATGLFDLAGELLLGPDEMMSRTVFSAVLRNAGDPAMQWSRRLMAAVIDAPFNAEIASMLLNSLHGLSPWWPRVEARLVYLHGLLGGDRFARQLLHTGAEDEAMLRQVRRWAQQEPTLFVGRPWQRFERLVAKGDPPMQAAEWGWIRDGDDPQHG